MVLVTSIPDASPELLLDLYRQRWQIELVCKRLKSVFKYHEIPVQLEQSAHSWFYGKLLLAALGETGVNKGRFSTAVSGPNRLRPSAVRLAAAPVWYPGR
ncbi:MAG: transposase [Treponema sp.]|nr:transposase [Treponema sp.]